ncbi:molybdate ABC transporter substrate-binding protein [Arcticibacter eurypsychrophilus]|uniref:molybdate ABC transporter substrate-binding protein n=1 Tax=Arcticibacter eurypsychrophilus TaxID=1434752 RepID=UPI00084DEACE|nr:molybdate ABC transporter substrate-binding protein [Arcticibacter eurypsychrophilus]
MKKILLSLLVLFSLHTTAQTIKVAAAANLRYILEEIKTNYVKLNPKTHLVLTIGSSGTLYQQIINGASHDIFMAADKIFPEKLKAQGAVIGEVKTYAYGKLAIWSNSVDVKSMNILLSESVKHIAVAKPDLAPYGERAIQCLKYYHLYDQVKDKLVFADNISQAAQFAQTGNAEVGILALSLVKTPEMKGSYIMPDPKSYKPVEQAMVLVKGFQYNPGAAKFMKFVMSAACKPIFEKYGYIVP